MPALIFPPKRREVAALLTSTETPTFQYTDPYSWLDAATCFQFIFYEQRVAIKKKKDLLSCRTKPNGTAMGVCSASRTGCHSTAGYEATSWVVLVLAVTSTSRTPAASSTGPLVTFPSAAPRFYFRLRKSRLAESSTAAVFCRLALPRKNASPSFLPSLASYLLPSSLLPQLGGRASAKPGEAQERRVTSRARSTRLWPKMAITSTNYVCQMSNALFKLNLYVKSRLF